MAIDLDWKGADRLLKQVLQILPREAAQALDGLNAAQVEEIRLRCGQVPSILRRGVEQPLPHCERTPQQEQFEPLTTAPFVSVGSRIIAVLRGLVTGRVKRLRQLFQANGSRSQTVATFLAVLELVRAGRIEIAEDETLKVKRKREER